MPKFDTNPLLSDVNITYATDYVYKAAEPTSDLSSRPDFGVDWLGFSFEVNPNLSFSLSLLNGH
jgi:hypothetical protein